MPRAIVSTALILLVATAAKRWSRAFVATAAKRWRAFTDATTVWRRWLLGLTNIWRRWLLSMLGCAVQLVCACSLPTSASEPSDVPLKSILKWSSGDQLAGQVVEASPQALSWSSNLFEEPLQLRLGSLRAINWQYKQPAKLARHNFRVETTQGNLLVGDLIDCDQEMLRMESANLGVVAIPRKNVRSLVNLTGSLGRWLGPMSIEDWDADRQAKQSLMDTAQGQIVFPHENLVFKKFAVKEKTLIDVAFRWAGTLDMKFGFAVPKKWGKLDAPSDSKGNSNKDNVKAEKTDKSQGSSMVVMKMDPSVLEQLPRLEMFSDAMVLQQKELFDIILEEVDMAAGFLRLVFEWDPQASQMKAFDASGKLLATIALDPLTDDFEPGIFVLNQNGRLTLDHVVLMAVPGETNPTQEVIGTKQGILTGTVESFDGKMWSIRRASDQALIQVAKDDLYITHVACKTEEPSASDEATGDSKSLAKIEFRDGSRLTGELLSIADNSLRLLSDVGAQEVAIHLDRAQRLDFLKTARQSDSGQTEVGTHLLGTEEGQCHGWLSQEGGASAGLLWKPVGSDKAVSLLCGGFRIHSTDPTTMRTLQFIESMPPKNPNGYRDQLYLRNGDRFPANVLRVQSGKLYAAAFQRNATFPTGEVVRCLLGVPNAARSTLDNPPWQIVKGDEKPKLEAMDPGLMFSRYACHPSLLETGGFEITVRGGMNKTNVEVGMSINNEDLISRLEFKLFASKPSDPCTQVYLFVSALPGNMVSVNLCADPMLGDSRVPLSLRATDNIVCSFKIEESELIGRINGIEAYRKKLKLSPDSTRGVVVGLHDKLPIVSIQQENSYSVRNAFVRSDSREVALTEPRFVTHQPARSLLVGRNGDLWRADIVSMNDDTVTVRSGGRHLVIERSLVSSLLWPDLPLVEETPTESTSNESGEADQIGEANPGDTDQTDKGEVVKVKAVQPEVALVPPKAGKLTVVQLVLSDGTKLTLKLESWGSQTVVGSSPHYGRMELSTAEVIELRSGSQVAAAADYEGQQWRFKLGKNLPAEQKAPGGGEGQGEGREGAEAALVGQEAPTFHVKNLDGSDIDLAAYRGKVVVLDFWATWCGYCVEELREWWPISASCLQIRSN